MIELQNITIAFEGKDILRNFSLQIKQGETVCILGKSGCGKSSILMAILGFITPSSGSILFNNVALSTSTIQSFREKTAYLSQDFSFPYRTVKELMDAPFEFKANRHNRPSKEEIISSFASLGLEKDIYFKELNELSGGEKQRVMLALIKQLNKEIVLLDEPTSALDQASIALIVELLKAMVGKTIIIVSHDEQFTQHFDKQITL